MGSQRSKNSRRDDCRDVQACVYTDQLPGDIQGFTQRNTCAIIAKYTVTRPIEPRRYGGLELAYAHTLVEAYSSPYIVRPCASPWYIKGDTEA